MLLALLQVHFILKNTWVLLFIYLFIITTIIIKIVPKDGPEYIILIWQIQ